MLRRSFVIGRRHLRVVTPFETPAHRASFCSSSPSRPRLFYEDGNMLYEPTTRECVHDVFSPKLNLKINHAVRLLEKRKEESYLPDNPFVILDDPDEKSIILKRNYFEESIQVQVDIVDDEDRQRSKVFNRDRFDAISLVVTIVKQEQPSSLQITFTASPDNNLILHDVINKSPDKSGNQNAFGSVNLSVLGDNVKKDILEFLARRGIDSSLVNFLHEYMIGKSIKLNLMWFENMKQFIDT